MRSFKKKSECRLSYHEWTCNNRLTVNIKQTLGQQLLARFRGISFNNSLLRSYFATHF